ncbi:MAG: hypothetical protein ACE5GA_11225, partial [Candidatus Zixiibacteriota bacterium]
DSTRLAPEESLAIKRVIVELMYDSMTTAISKGNLAVEEMFAMYAPAGLSPDPINTPSYEDYITNYLKYSHTIASPIPELEFFAFTESTVLNDVGMIVVRKRDSVWILLGNRFVEPSRYEVFPNFSHIIKSLRKQLQSSPVEHQTPECFSALLMLPFELARHYYGERIVVLHSWRDIPLGRSQEEALESISPASSRLLARITPPTFTHKDGYSSGEIFFWTIDRWVQRARIAADSENIEILSVEKVVKFGAEFMRD